jgi:Tol biopolymer transport system component
LPFSSKEYCELQLSPDGRYLAVTVREIDGINLYIYELNRQVEKKVTNQGNIYAPVWTLDGHWITYACQMHGKMKIVKRSMQGREETMPFEMLWLRPSSWLPNTRN